MADHVVARKLMLELELARLVISVQYLCVVHLRSSDRVTPRNPFRLGPLSLQSVTMTMRRDSGNKGTAGCFPLWLSGSVIVTGSVFVSHGNIEVHRHSQDTSLSQVIPSRH
ncbi:hypothetical protein BaRGS_00038151 [Batillaria attramentaria]|uniref:Secreted protein n=1 Tax=Batillaria attramentaria TaxID=370345 RepID=A0ABD0J7Q4_9CAEN